MPEPLPSESLLAVELPMDGEAEAWLPDAAAGWLQEEPERALLAYGRMLQRLHREDQELVRMRAIFDDEVDAQRARLGERITGIDALVCAELERRRETTGDKSLSIPTVGTWQSRSVPGGWEFPTKDADLVALIPEWDRDALIEKVTVEKPKREAIREYLEAAVGTWVQDEIVGESQLPLDELDIRARESVSNAYDISYRQPRVSVRGPFSEPK